MNVGCIPKKLFHISTLVRENMKMAEDYGWGKSDSQGECDWETLRGNVNNYVRGISFGYKSKLKTQGIDFIDAKASFQDEHHVQFEY